MALLVRSSEDNSVLQRWGMVTNSSWATWDFSGFQSRSPVAPQGKWSPEMGAELVRRFEWLLLEAFACCVQADLLAAAGCLSHWVSAAFQLDFRDGSFLGIIPRVTGMLLPRASLSLVNNRPTRGTSPSQGALSPRQVGS